eukprot:272794-Rhodomonas_salina.3
MMLTHTGVGIGWLTRVVSVAASLGLGSVLSVSHHLGRDQGAARALAVNRRIFYHWHHDVIKNLRCPGILAAPQFQVLEMVGTRPDTACYTGYYRGTDVLLSTAAPSNSLAAYVTPARNPMRGYREFHSTMITYGKRGALGERVRTGARVQTREGAGSA